MAINIGDKIIYRDEDRDGKYVAGEIVDIWVNDRDTIIGYFAALDSGLYVHIKPNSHNWCKLVEPALVA
jgi:hypothetical protein